MRLLAPDEDPREEEWVPCGLGPCWAEEGHDGPCMLGEDESADPWPDTEDAAAAHYAACNPEPGDPS